MKRNSLSKGERLRSRIEIEDLMKKGQRFGDNELKMIYKIGEQRRENQIQVVFSVPKRKFKRAVDRNLIRRRMRESYRLNKHPLYEKFSQNNMALNIMFLYQSNEVLSFATIKNKLVLLLKQLLKIHEKSY